MSEQSQQPSLVGTAPNPMSIAAIVNGAAPPARHAPAPVRENGSSQPRSPKAPATPSPPRPDLNTASPIRSASRSQGSPRMSSPKPPTPIRQTSTAGSPTGVRNLSRQPSSPSMSRLNSAFAPPTPTDAPPLVTAATIARAHFEQELQMHGQPHGKATVVVHDDCYGHRFSRPKSTKTTLSLIVERPERIQACVAGIANAYTKIGGKHAAGTQPILSNVRHAQIPFSIKRSTRSLSLSSPFVTNVHGTKWMQELTEMCDTAQEKLASGGKELSRPDSTLPPKPKLHDGDLYLCKESRNAFQGALGGVLDGVDAAFSTSSPRAFVCIRPPGHHCSADMPSGFCWVNNVHVGIEYAAQTFGLTHAAIVDFDLHHGDGSQAITWERNDKAAKAPKNSPQSKKTSIGYFSLHDINSYPCEWGDLEKVQSASLCLENAHNQTIWNVHLQPWKTEEEFWILYRERYSILLDKARTYLAMQSKKLQEANIKPKSAIFISAGFDASEHEGAGMQRHKVNVPTEFYARFTQDMIRLAEENATSADGRVISVLEGGYSDRALMSGVLSHLSGLAAESVESSWWHEDALAEFEAKYDDDAPVKKSKAADFSTSYASPTQSFTAKVVDPSKMYRTASGTIVEGPPSPPPEVDWITATHELTKLLIPTNRTVGSCRHEELSEPRTKREATTGTAIAEADKIQTRGKRGKLPTYPEHATEIDLPIRGGPDRRRTFSGSQKLTDAEQIRPSTSDSKAPSEESVKAAGGRSSRAASPKKREPPKARRHVSGIVPPSSELNVSEQVPPVPSLPAKELDNHQLRDSASPAATSSDGVERIISGVKKITLKMPTREPARPAVRKATNGQTTNKATIAKSAARTKPPGVSLHAGAAAGPKSVPVKTESAVVNGSPPPAGSLGPPATSLSDSGMTDAVKPSEKQDAVQDSADTLLRPEQTRAKPPVSTNSQDMVQSTFVQYDPASHYDVANQQRSEIKPDTITWLPPNSSTPEQTPVKRDANIQTTAPSVQPPRPVAKVATPAKPAKPLEKTSSPKPQKPQDKTVSPSKPKPQEKIVSPSKPRPQEKVVSPTKPPKPQEKVVSPKPQTPQRAQGIQGSEGGTPRQEKPLPVFSSSGVIPFGPRPTSQGSPAPAALTIKDVEHALPQPQSKEATSIWDVPVTPARPV